MKAKFKVGDKVKILDGSRISNYTGGWWMHEDVGKTGTIETIVTYNNPERVGYHLKELDYCYDERGLELVRDEMTPKFKVGDLVRGNNEYRYSVTNSDMTKGEVVYVNSSGTIDVRVLEHTKGYSVGHTFHYLDVDYFDKIENKSTPDWKVIIIPDGDKTIGKLFEHGKLTTTVETKKHPKDEYSIKEAIKSITARLVEEREKAEAKFKVGDIVEIVECDNSTIPVGVRGEVVFVHSNGVDIGVDFKMKYHPWTHTLWGKIKTVTGRWYDIDKLKLVHRP
jgi:ribosomal protein S17